MSIDLRAAEVSNYWRNLLSKRNPFEIETISYVGLSCLENANLNFSGGITAIIGANGVGKSTIASAIAELLAGVTLDESKIRLMGSQLAGSARKNGVVYELFVAERTQDLNPNRSEPISGNSFGWLDPTFAPEKIRAIHADANFNEVLEGLTPRELTADELKEVSYLVNKPYLSCQIYDVEEYAHFTAFPYFSVSTKDGASYQSETMGTGELSLLTYYWMLYRVGRGAILIIEEPETYLSPHSQLALMNVLAKVCSENKVSVVVTTHSPTILRKIPLENIRLLMQIDGRSFFTRKTTIKQIEDVLGEGTSRKACLLVEDDGARSFLQEIVATCAPDLTHIIEVLPCGDETRLTQAITNMPKAGKWLKIVGVYDGNMRQLRGSSKLHWPFCFLPQNSDPDALLQELMSDRIAREKLASLLDKDLEEFEVACANHQGISHHDWPIEMQKTLGSDIISIRRKATKVWLSIDLNLEAARNFVMDLRAALS